MARIIAALYAPVWFGDVGNGALVTASARKPRLKRLHRLGRGFCVCLRGRYTTAAADNGGNQKPSSNGVSASSSTRRYCESACPESSLGATQTALSSS